MLDSKADSPVLSILIVNYNGLHFLEACLNSLCEEISIPFEVVMVDNASTDGSAKYVEHNFPWVNLIASDKNLGFAAGNNRAAAEAQGRYYLLLNNDTVMLTDVVCAIHVLEQDLTVGVVGAKMYNQDLVLQRSTGHFPAVWRLCKFTLQWSNPERHPFGKPELSAFKTDWVQGSCLLTTSENWNAVGGLDESVFMYGEDVEFCAYTFRRGLLTVQCADFEYKHFGGYEVSRMGLLYAGYRRYHARFSPWAVQIAADIVLFAGLIARILTYGFLALVTRREAMAHKFRRFVDVAMHWSATAPKPAIFSSGQHS